MGIDLDILAWIVLGLTFSFGIVPAFVDHFSDPWDHFGYWDCWLKGHGALLILLLFLAMVFCVSWAVFRVAP